MAPLTASPPPPTPRGRTFERRLRMREREHLRERTLSTAQGDTFQLAMSPWTRQGSASGCLVAAGRDGRIFAAFTLWEYWHGARRKLALIAGVPDWAVTQAVLEHLRARLG
ncbi:hypothetical protein LZC95_19670 [Pendulispora brunnea]|uniref:Uncharacterized protein n=1 Tax=Pendulispora brunnea TaxID=2905690 RepID=A0ABZ2KK25_9BACT